MLLPGQIDFLGTMYSFGAMLSFTIAHASVVALRAKPRGDEVLYRARPNLRIRGFDRPLFAILGGLGTAIAWIVVVIQDAADALGRSRLAGARLRRLLACTAARRHAPLTETVRAPALVARAVADARLPDDRRAGDAVDRVGGGARRRGAARRRPRRDDRGHPRARGAPRAAARRAAPRPEAAEELLDDAQALVEGYGVRAVTRLIRARRAGPAIVEEARARTAELIVLGSPRRSFAPRRRIFGGTVDYVLREAPCRVLITAGKRSRERAHATGRGGSRVSGRA